MVALSHAFRPRYDVGRLAWRLSLPVKIKNQKKAEETGMNDFQTISNNLVNALSLRYAPAGITIIIPL